VKRLAKIIMSILRELADENAYNRYLNGRPPSREEWRQFSDRRMRDKYARAKCC
jgi:hypothetical protein